MEAIVLLRRDFRENDQIIALYTAEKGKLEVLARGVKKIISKNTSHLEPCFLVEAEILPGKEINHLTKVQPINIFKNIRSDLNKILLASYTINLANKFLQSGEKDEKVFNFLKDWLDFLDKSPMAGEVLAFSFLLKLLFLLGFKPELGKCVVCGGEELAGFYFSGGGAVCQSCGLEKKGEGKEVVACPKNDLASLKMLLNGSWEEVAGATIQPKACKISHRFAEYHSERKLAYFGLI